MSPCDHPRQRLRAAFMTLPFFLRGIIGPRRKQSAACSVVYSGMMAHRPQRRERMAEFFFPSVLWPHICIRHSKAGLRAGRSAKQAQNNGFKGVQWRRPQWWQFAVQRADTPIQINPSINSESTLVGILDKGCFFSDVLHQSWAWVHQKSLWIFTKFINNTERGHKSLFSSWFSRESWCNMQHTMT